MPNWSYNTIAVKGKKQDVIYFLNVAVKEHPNRPLLTQDMDYLDIADSLNLMNKKDEYIHLRSWMPMPSTFLEYDTTNSMLEYDTWKDRHGLFANSLEDASAFCALTEDERHAQYDDYVRGYKKAKQYQQATYGCVGWFDYNEMTLGTKWDANIDEFLCDQYGDTLVVRLSCDTAWNFPSAWLDTMQKDYPLLTFFCYAKEEGNDYCGYFNVKETNWVENWDNLYAECLDEIKASEDYNEDDESDMLYDLISQKEDEIYNHFLDYVFNYDA